MRLGLAVTGLVVGAVTVSSALASSSADHGKPQTAGAGCKPQIAVVLKGTLASTPGASATSISVKVASGNRWGRAYVAAAQPRSIAVNAGTKIRRQGDKTLGSLVSGDRVLVQSRACKAELANGALPPLTASKVVAHSATSTKNEDEDKAEKGKQGKEDNDDEEDDD